MAGGDFDGPKLQTENSSGEAYKKTRGGVGGRRCSGGVGKVPLSVWR